MATRIALEGYSGRHLRAVEAPGIPTPPGGVSRVALRAITEASDRRLQTLMAFYRIAEESEMRIQSLIDSHVLPDDYASGEELLWISSAQETSFEPDIAAPTSSESISLPDEETLEPISWMAANTVATDGLINKFAANQTPATDSALDIESLTNDWANPKISALLAA